MPGLRTRATSRQSSGLWWQVQKTTNYWQPRIVHCHIPITGALGRYRAGNNLFESIQHGESDFRWFRFVSASATVATVQKVTHQHISRLSLSTAAIDHARETSCRISVSVTLAVSAINIWRCYAPKPLRTSSLLNTQEASLSPTDNHSHQSSFYC